MYIIYIPSLHLSSIHFWPNPKTRNSSCRVNKFCLLLGLGDSASTKAKAPGARCFDASSPCGRSYWLGMTTGRTHGPWFLPYFWGKW